LPHIRRTPGLSSERAAVAVGQSEIDETTRRGEGSTSMRGSGRTVIGCRWAVPALIALASAACGNGGQEPGAPGLSGEPVVVGFVNLEGAPVGSIPELRVGAEAALQYINAELNGLGGRPLEFDVCITNGSPESSTACANQMVERRVVAVLGGVDLGSAASLPILTAAGIPYIGMTPLLPADFTTDGAFTLDPGGLGTAANAAYAADELGAERVAVLHDDSPQGKQLAEAFVKPVLLKRGIRADSVELVAEKQDAADLSPAVAAATRTNPDAVIVVFPPPACSRIMQAVGALGVDAHMLYIGRCGGPSALAAGGAGAEGAYFFSSIRNVDAHRRNRDVRLYSEKIEQFGGPDVDPASYDTARAFATVMTFYQRLATLEPDTITPASVTAAFRAAVDAPAFMGSPYTCDGRQSLPGFVSVCNTRVRIYQFSEGRYRDASGGWISAGAALGDRAGASATAVGGDLAG
jgi:branched-chain amino acid transport system substrate-binding protein